MQLQKPITTGTVAEKQTWAKAKFVTLHDNSYIK